MVYFTRIVGHSVCLFYAYIIFEWCTPMSKGCRLFGQCERKDKKWRLLQWNGNDDCREATERVSRGPLLLNITPYEHTRDEVPNGLLVLSESLLPDVSSPTCFKPGCAKIFLNLYTVVTSVSSTFQILLERNLDV